MNLIVLTGRLTKDPEAPQAVGQTVKTRFTIAVDRIKKSDNGNNADFISVNCWGSTAENVSKYLKKGRQVLVSGHITTGDYEKDGKRIYTTDINADRVEFLGSGSAPGQSKTASQPQTDVEEAFQEAEDDIPF